MNVQLTASPLRPKEASRLGVGNEFLNFVPTFIVISLWFGKMKSVNGWLQSFV